jgi:hypothetical protein
MERPRRQRPILLGLLALVALVGAAAMFFSDALRLRRSVPAAPDAADAAPR